MARRSSYASVLAGSASGGGPGRSGFSYPGGREPGSITHQRSPSTPQTSTRPGGGLSQSHPTMSGSPFGGDDLPPYPGGLGSLGMEPKTPLFYIPSYLKYSRHAEKLEEKHKARLKAARDGPPPGPRSGTGAGVGGGSLSRSGSGISLHRMVPSHRGMTYDIQERVIPPSGEEALAPLPTRWNAHDKFQGLELSQDGFECTFAVTGKTTVSDEAAALRADHYMPKACGIYYYEIEILTKGREAPIGIGFSSAKASLNRLPGWEPESFAYHGDDGFSFNQTSSGKAYGPKFGYQDVIGCGIDFGRGTVFFTRNGVNLGTAFREVKADKCYPSVGMKKPGEKIRVNFGLEPFVFNIDGFVNRHRDRIKNDITEVPIDGLHHAKNVPVLLQELVGQYLAHEGYTETTKAFGDEVRHMQGLFQTDQTGNANQIDYKEDLDASKRQRIRSEILHGDIDLALKHTRAYYPSVLKENENIYFKLRCREVLEMIKKSVDMSSPPKSKRPTKPLPNVRNTNGHARSPTEDVNVFSSTGDMDVDTDSLNPSPNNVDDEDEEDEEDEENEEEGAEAEAPDADSSSSDEEDGPPALKPPPKRIATNGTAAPTTTVSNEKLVLEALHFGRELQREFSQDPRREIKEALTEIWALWSYTNGSQLPASHAHLLEEEGRVPVAEELNGAILVSLGQSSVSALERLVQQTDLLTQEISKDGGGAALLNLRLDYLQ